MQTLCPITDWQTSIVEKGPFKGNETKQRYVAAADNWCWIIGLQRNKEDANVVGEKFYGNMRHFLPALFKQISPVAPITVVKALLNRIGVKQEVPTEFTSEAECEKYGKSLDDSYGTSYMREYPPTVMKRIFKSEEKDET